MVKIDPVNKRLKTEAGEVIEFKTTLELLVYVRDIYQNNSTYEDLSA